jgi:hypothetical protein
MASKNVFVIDFRFYNRSTGYYLNDQINVLADDGDQAISKARREFTARYKGYHRDNPKYVPPVPTVQGVRLALSDVI